MLFQISTGIYTIMRVSNDISLLCLVLLLWVITSVLVDHTVQLISL